MRRRANSPYLKTLPKAVDPVGVGKGTGRSSTAWQGAEIPADMHGAVARYNLEFTDAVIEFDFRLDGDRSPDHQRQEGARLPAVDSSRESS